MANQEAVDVVLAQTHKFKNSDIDVKAALDREQARSKADAERQRKIFAGGLPKNMTDDRLRDYFSQFGRIHKCYVVKDAYSGKTRGFGFVIFAEDQGFQASLAAPEHMIDGQEVHLKRAEVKEEETCSVPNKPISMMDSDTKATKSKQTNKEKQNAQIPAKRKKKQQPPQKPHNNESRLPMNRHVPSPNSFYEYPPYYSSVRTSYQSMHGYDHQHYSAAPLQQDRSVGGNSYYAYDHQPMSQPTPPRVYEFGNYDETAGGHYGRFRDFGLYDKSASGRMIYPQDSRQAYPQGIPFPRPLPQPEYLPFSNGSPSTAFSMPTRSPPLQGPEVTRDYPDSLISPGAEYPNQQQNKVEKNEYSPFFSSKIEPQRAVTQTGRLISSQLPSPQSDYHQYPLPIYGHQHRSAQDIYPPRRIHSSLKETQCRYPVQSGSQHQASGVKMQPAIEIVMLPQGRRPQGYTDNPFIPHEDETEDYNHLRRAEEF